MHKKGVVCKGNKELNEVEHILLKIKCPARLGSLVSDSCIIDNKLQLQDNLEYYFILRQITHQVI